MRRLLPILLFVFVLATPFVARRALRPPQQAVPAASRPAGRLVVLTPHNQDIRREFDAAFRRWHVARYDQDVVMDFRTAGATNDIKRQLDTHYRQDEYRTPDGKLKPPDQVAPAGDVIWGGGDYFFDRELKAGLGVLQPMRLDRATLAAVYPQPALAGVKLYDPSTDAAGDPAPHWVGVCLSAFGIVYNPDLYANVLRLPPPQTWSDLTTPRLAGLVALADPTHSGSAAVAYQMVIQRAMADAEEAYRQTLRGPDGTVPPIASLDKKAPAYQRAIADGWRRGMGDLTLIAANARYFTDNAPQVPNDIGNGQAAAGMAIDFYGRVYQESVGPDRCRFVSPPAATAITPDPVAVLYGVRGEQLKLAMHFVEFLLTPEGQELWVKRVGAPGGPVSRALRRPPVRADLYAAGRDRSTWTDEVNPFAEAGGFNQRGEWMALFADTRPIWAAAWIDARDALKDAHAAVVAVPDPARQQALLDELAFRPRPGGVAATTSPGAGPAAGVADEDSPVTMAAVEKDVAKRKELEKSRGDVDAWKAHSRMDWARKFRDHFRRVEQKARG